MFVIVSVMLKVQELVLDQKHIEKLIYQLLFMSCNLYATDPFKFVKHWIPIIGLQLLLNVFLNCEQIAINFASNIDETGINCS